MDANTTLTGEIRQEQYEHLLVGAAMLGGEAVLQACGDVQAEEFADWNCRYFWKAFATGATAERAALDANCYARALEWTKSVDTYLSCVEFARKMREQRTLNETLGPLLPKLAKAWKEGDFQEAAELVRSLGGLEIGAAQPFASTKEQIEAAIEYVFSGGEVLRTGIAPLDSVAGGLEKQLLVLLAARPSMGKSTLAFQIARNLAAGKHKTVFFSLEMSSRQFWIKAACGQLQINPADVKARRISTTQKEAIATAARNLYESYGEYIRINDKDQTSESVWRTVSAEKPEAVVIDHTSLLQDKGDNETHRLDNVSKRMKSLAKAHNIAVLLCQQLSRETERRENKMPVLSDLRDSGGLEQNADVILMMYRPDYYNTQLVEPKKYSETHIYIRKNRDGALDKLRMWYGMAEQWFYSKQEMLEAGLEAFTR